MVPAGETSSKLLYLTGQALIGYAVTVKAEDTSTSAGRPSPLVDVVSKKLLDVLGVQLETKGIKTSPEGLFWLFAN